jgi:hypothetical protein
MDEHWCERATERCGIPRECDDEMLPLTHHEQHKDQNFVIQTINKEQLVIAPKFLPEIRMLPESKLSHAQVLIDYWVGEHIGADLAMAGYQHIDAVRGPLTRSLSKEQPNPPPREHSPRCLD